MGLLILSIFSIFFILNFTVTLLLIKYGLTRYTKYEKNGNDD